MEKRIELEKRGRRPNQITELNLDNCRSTSIVGLTDEFTALESLSLINVGLTTLKGFPNLPNLKKLELSDNRISNGLNYLETSPKLTHLALSGNKIKDLEALKPLEKLRNLQVLDLFNNEATSIENYRDKIFAMIPSLKYLDGFDANEVEASSEGEDDDEVNGNDSDDDNKPICINGLEIDLDELDKFEKQLKIKKNYRFENKNNDIDELDEYLEKLKLNDRKLLDDESMEISFEHDNENKPNIVPSCSKNSNKCINTNCDVLSEKNYNSSLTTDISRDNNTTISPMQLPLLLYGFIAILSLINYAYYENAKDCEGEDDDEDEDDGDSDEEDHGDVSLADVYNDDLEEDNSEWGEENEAEEEDDDDDDESDGEEGNNDSTTKDKPNNSASEEPQARGKKRKHDG